MKTPNFKTIFVKAILVSATLLALPSQAAEYRIDDKGAHAFVQFKIKHLGYSWLLGRFNTFEGDFTWDQATPEKSKIRVTIDTTSLDSNHAERDKHLKGKDFLEVNKFPEASFSSSKFEITDAEHAVVTGELKLHGVTKTISFPVQKVGEGNDPWNGYRAGFEGEVTLVLKDYGIDFNLGPASTSVTMGLYIEGIRQ